MAPVIDLFDLQMTVKILTFDCWFVTYVIELMFGILDHLRNLRISFIGHDLFLTKLVVFAVPNFSSHEQLY